MKGKRMSALATAGLMAMTALAAMPQSAMADEEKTVINIWSKDRHDADYVQKKVDVLLTGKMLLMHLQSM